MAQCWSCKLRGCVATRRQVLRAQPAVQRAAPARARTVDRDAEITKMEEMNVSSLDRYKIHWYPGHVAAAERKLQEHLSRVDIVFDVRDARCLRSTEHPKVAGWVKGKRRFVIINRTDMVSTKDLRMWRQHFKEQGLEAFFVNAQHGTGISALKQAAAAKSDQVNASRTRRGLKPRPVRACVIGYPNIGKSALINRLLGRRVVDSYKQPGVTRTLRWVRMSDELDLLDSPGIIPSQIKDQSAAVKLAICNDIGEAAYLNSAVAAQFLTHVQHMQNAESLWPSLKRRYHFTDSRGTPEDLIEQLSERRFDGQLEQAGQRILNDYRNLRLGRFALELPGK